MSKKYSATQINSELFYKFPKFLLENKRYATLSNDARVLYALIKDRYRYSLASGWVDEENAVYVYFTIDELKDLLHIGKNKVTRIKSQLVEVGLLEIVKQGFDPKSKKNRPDKFYLLQPEYDPKDLYSQTSQVKPLDTSDFPILGIRGENEETAINQESISSEKCYNPTSSLEPSDFPILGTNKEENNLDTILDTTIDTKKWNFSTENYSQEEIEKQNKDLMKHIGEVLTEDTLPMFLNKETIDILTLWLKTPEQVSEAISTILNSANDSRKEAVNQLGKHELDFDNDSELRKEVTNKLRRYFNRMRTSKPGEIKDPKSYLYATMRNLFDSWQNRLMMKEKEM